MALGTAFRAFFGSLFNSETAARVQAALDLEPAAANLAAPSGSPEKTTAPPRPLRSDGVALLATLQREARFVDLLQEPLGQFSDAQVGAAARPCLQQCAATLERVLALAPVVDSGEGETVEIPTDASPAAYQWIGEGEGRTGQLIHQGWRATRVDLPAWTGPDADVLVIAPAQIKR